MASSRNPVTKRPTGATPANCRADHGAAERWQHCTRVLELTEAAGVLAARVLEAHILDGLCAKGVITAPARDAGLRLYADYQAAHLASRVTASYQPVRSGNQGGYSEYERTDAEEAAYQRWRMAVRAVGLVDSRVVLAVCCHEQNHRLEQRPSLTRGLAVLAKHYGISGN